MQILALPICAFMAFLILVMWGLLTSRFDMPSAPGEIAVVFAAVALSGALLRFSAYLGTGLSNQPVLGFWPSRLTLYAVHSPKSTKRNFIASSLLPFFVLAVLPLLVAAILRISPGWLVFGSFLAAAMFGADAVLALTAWRLPARCVIAARGFQPYWRLPP
jgi:hypothetical protein